MRTIAVLAWVATTLFISPAFTSAQDDEEEADEGGGDIDELMSGDPERPAKEPDAEEDTDDAEEKAPAPDGELGEATDDERPPGDEPSAPDAPPELEGEPEDAGGHPKPLSVGILIGGGFSLEGGSNSANPWGLGLGLRGGYNLNDFYLGAGFAYYLGETVTVSRPTVSGSTREEDVSYNQWQLGVEAGYDIHAGSVLVLRPEFGLGFASVSGVTSQTSVFISPGLAVLFDVSPGFFLGVDARYQLVATEISISGMAVLGTLGMRF
jgi:hypothetical protein